MNVSIDKARQKPLKKIIKRSVQHIAAAFGPHTRTAKEPRLLVLMYHRILPDDDPRYQLEEPGMVVTPDTLRLHLKTVKEHFNIVKLSDWAQLKNNNKTLPANACAITFDDGWADNYEFAFPILKDLETPATIFLVAEMIGTNQNFWPERLVFIMTTIATHYPQHWGHAELLWLQTNPELYRFNKTPPTNEEISALITCLKNYSDQDMHDRLNHIEEVLQLDINKPAPSLLDWQQVDDMVHSDLIEMGSHTCRHTRLNENTPATQIKDEIVNSKKIIEQHIGKPVNIFCYPNGDTCAEAREQVRKNYHCAVTTKAGWNTQQTDAHMLHRVGIHQDNTADKTAFLARISGWM